MMRPLVLAFGMAVVPLVAAAAPSPAPPASEAARNGGMIDGRVNYVDFQRSMLGVDSPARGKVDVSVMPTTSIESRDAGYHAFTDVRPGQRVSIMSSLVDGKYVAQIIRIR